MRTHVGMGCRLAAGVLAAVLVCDSGRAQETPELAAGSKAMILVNGELWEAKLVKSNVETPAKFLSYRPTLTISVAKIPVLELVRYFCLGSGMKYRLTLEGIIVEPRGFCFPDDGRLQILKMKPAFDGLVQRNAGKLSAGADPVLEYLKLLGLTMYMGMSVHYEPEAHVLILRSYAGNIEQIEGALRAVDAVEKAVFTIKPPEPMKELTPGDVPYGKTLELVIPRFEVEDMPVHRALLQLARTVREADPEHKGISIMLLDQDYGSPVVVPAEEWHPAQETLPPTANPQQK